MRSAWLTCTLSVPCRKRHYFLRANAPPWRNWRAMACCPTATNHSAPALFAASGVVLSPRFAGVLNEAERGQEMLRTTRELTVRQYTSAVQQHAYINKARVLVLCIHLGHQNTEKCDRTMCARIPASCALWLEGVAYRSTTHRGADDDYPVGFVLGVDDDVH
ncbi:unnamed protein product [Rangifer tarandus platyrhynchus]|uniref:Uncharacterized protein n=1 Tax=Rangifer tarandus platyrhynchus TaxID=3082113 RepID=A0ACB1KEG7_RANTA